MDVNGVAIEDIGNENQYLTFSSGNELYGLPIKLIREVIEYPPVTRVPLVKKTIHGVMNLRGNVVTVIDLSFRLYQKESTAGDKCVIVAEIEDAGEIIQIGLLINSVYHVLDIPPEKIDEDPAFGAKIPNEFITGIGKVDGKFIILLDMDKLINTEELTELVG